MAWRKILLEVNSEQRTDQLTQSTMSTKKDKKEWQKTLEELNALKSAAPAQAPADKAE